MTGSPRSRLPRQAAILAGGFGTRLRSVVADRPKVLAPVGGRPFVEYLLDQLASAGIESVVLCTGYRGELVSACLGASYRGLALKYSPEPAPLGTGGALRLALPLLHAGATLVMNGDSYFDGDFGSLPQWHAERSSVATIVLASIDDARRYGRVDVDAGGQVVRFREKSDEHAAALVNAGIYLVEHAFIASIAADREVSIEREVFPSWIGRGLHGMACEGRLWDIGVPDAYARADAEFAPSLRQ